MKRKNLPQTTKKEKRTNVENFSPSQTNCKKIDKQCFDENMFITNKKEDKHKSMHQNQIQYIITQKFNFKKQVICNGQKTKQN